MSGAAASAFERFSGLSDVKKRAVGAIVGAAVADAATRPFHWLYDSAALGSIVKSSNPEFWPENHSPFYSLPTGRRSCYNDTGLALLFSLPTSAAATPADAFSKDAYIDSLLDMFSPTSEYANALKLRVVAYAPERRLEKREPVPGPWQHQAVTFFLAAVAKDRNGPTGHDTSVEADALTSTIPLVAKLAALFGENAEADAVLTSAQNVLGTAPGALSFAAAASAAIRRVILTGDVSEDSLGAAIASAEKADAITAFRAVTEFIGGEKVPQPAFIKQINTFGWTCNNPGTFQGAVLTVLTSSDFVSGVRQNILAGGCNCSRANFAGALLGAAYGIGTPSGIPLEWIDRTDKGQEIFQRAIDIVA